MVIDIPHNKKSRVVIIGGGFGGVQIAKKLKNKDVQVILIDKNNYHTFQPLLYQVATSVLESESIAYPLRKIFKNAKNIFFRLGEVTKIDSSENKIYIDSDELSYDHLIIATGAKTNFFGNDGLIVNSMPMKSIIEALDLRSMILHNFEKALRNSNERKRKGMMNFVIAGAGPTGVELAGAMGELKLHVLPHDYPELDFEQMNIYLVQSGDRVLPMLNEKSSEKAKQYLEKLGVKVVLNTRVLDVSGDYVQTSTEQDIIAKTLIWTAGVKGNPVEGLGKEAIVKGNRIEVDEFNRVKGYENIYAVGDVACMKSEEYPFGHPMIAPPAMQQGSNLSKNLIRVQNGKEMKPFKYVNKGAMATVGKNKAIVEIGKFKSRGTFAWFVWMGVHLMSLVGFRNKLITFFNWTKNYFSSDRGMRLMISKYDPGEERRKRKQKMKIEHLEASDE